MCHTDPTRPNLGRERQPDPCETGRVRHTSIQHVQLQCIFLSVAHFTCFALSLVFLSHPLPSSCLLACLIAREIAHLLQTTSDVIYPKQGERCATKQAAFESSRRYLCRHAPLFFRVDSRCCREKQRGSSIEGVCCRACFTVYHIHAFRFFSSAFFSRASLSLLASRKFPVGRC